MYVVISTIPFDPEYREEAKEAMAQMSQRSRKEDGVINHRACVSVEDDTLLRVIEQYEDLEAIDSHMNSEHFHEFHSEFEAYMGDESRADVVQFEVAEAVGFEDSRVAQNL